ncbi:RNA-dependent RNA polymerase [Alstroemeria yellow spot virus]|uniref:RNA-directed RNA polymerase L n=1 Tax=Alstroemeria yellow spot virus TaxID=2212644 RepID=A0A344AIG9_9VIRU|nr:RNA-dependent RNA polymerase [Alstroemeria yellow spot virus]AWV56660.1 RNA-dependent RNA polymerase [Alstroemeria yellow spot virus]
MNLQNVHSFLEITGPITVSLSDIREKLILLSNIIQRKYRDGSEAISSGLKAIMSMSCVIDEIVDMKATYYQSTMSIDQKEMEKKIFIFLDKYKELELMRHDLFGVLASSKLHFAPKHRHDVVMKDCILNYLEYCSKKEDISNKIDNLDELVSQLVFQHQTPDNYVIYKETTGEKACLMIYDWKVSVDTMTENKTSENYYTGIWKTFKDIKVNGEPFLKRYPIFVTIVILQPMNYMPIVATTCRVIEEMRNSPYRTFVDRRNAASRTKLISVKNLRELAGQDGPSFTNFYSECQAFKNLLMSKISDYMNRTDEVFFSNWSFEYKNTTLKDNLMSQDIIKIIKSLPNDVISKELMVHFIFGNYVFHSKTMSDLHRKDKFDGYKTNCKLMWIKPKETEESLKVYLENNEHLFESLYAKHMEKIKTDMISKKSQEKEIKSIEESFNINATNYQLEYPGCFTNDLQETKTNFSVCWSPSTEKLDIDGMNFNNSIVENFRTCFDDEEVLIHNKSYGGKSSQGDFSGTLFRLVKTCLKDLSCDTTGHNKIRAEDVIDIKDGSIKISRASKEKCWVDIGKVKTRNGNEFTLGDGPSKETRSRFFKGLTLMNIDMGKKRKNEHKLKLMEKLKMSRTANEETMLKEGEYDVSSSTEIVDEPVGSISHNKKLIRHDNPDVKYWCNSMIQSMYALNGFDIREKETGKINSVYSEYCNDPKKYFTKGKLIETEMNVSINLHKLSQSLAIYSYSEDMMQLAKGLMVADRFMRKTDFKILTCANTSMLCLAFKGDGLNTGKSGVPYITLHRVPELLQPHFASLYTKELVVSFKHGDYFINIMRPQRLNQVRLLSLFKAPSKVPICFAQYCLLSSEVKKWLSKKSIDILECPSNVVSYLKNILFSSVVIGTVTKLSRMGIFDFMRYAGFLPLSDYSNIKEYIAEKFDPDITNVVDCYFVSGIKNLLLKMEGINLSNSIKPLTIDQENDMSGGIGDLNIICPITGSTLKTIECLYNNVYLAIYMMPKSLHTHIHNLTSLLNVPAEWEVKFREKMGFGLDEEITPKKEMFNDSGPFSIDGALNVKTLFDYYIKTVDNVSSTRSNIESKEDFLSTPYKIKTLTSSKKCSKAEIIKNSEIKSCLSNCLGKDPEKINGKDEYVLKGVLKCFVEDKDALRNFMTLEELEESDYFHYFNSLTSGENKTLMKTSYDKFYQNSHPTTVETYIKVRYGHSSTTTVLKSKKVSEELYDLIKEYNKITTLDLDALENLGRGLSGSKMTFIQLLEFVLMKTRTNAGNTDFLVSVFEKMQRTKMDREIYLMSMKTKMMLYFIEHTYKHIAQSDPSEAISISGDYKIKTLASLSYDTITNYNTTLQKGLECKMAFLSADQSKWSASDLTYKYILAVLMNPVLTTGEINMMCECILMYVKLKRVCIPTDVFLNLKRGQSTYGSYGTAISALTNNLETNTFPVSMNWLQGNLNYLSSVYHSCAMLGYEKALKTNDDFEFTVRWMVHSDDNATSVVVKGDISNFLTGFNSANLSEFLFRSIQSHFKSYCITLNPKKSYASESEVEFISERIINGAVIPLYCRHLANCCTESSHNSYFDDLMSLSIHVTMLLRKGCPNELITFAYSAIQCQALSIYSMLPGEENDVMAISKEIDFPLLKEEIPTCAGGWMRAPVEMLSILGPSSNDQYIYYKVLLEFFKQKDFSTLKTQVNSLGFVTLRINELNKRVINNQVTKEDIKMICLVNLFKTSLMSEDSDSLNIGIKFQTMMTQIIKLPSYVSESSLMKNSSFQDFCKLFPNLKKNSDLLKSLKRVQVDEDDINETLEDDYMVSKVQMEELYKHMSKHPEALLIAPMNDKDYILTNLYTYSSISKRNQMSNQSTEKLALDRILRSKAKTFIDPNSKQMMTYKENMSSKLKEVMDKSKNDYKIIYTMADMITKDMNFEMIISLMENSVANASIPKANYNFRWFITEKVPSIIEGSPGLIVMSAIYGMEYLVDLGLKRLPLTENSICILHDIFGNRKTFDDVKKYLTPDGTELKTEEFILADDLKRKVLSINYMIQSQNKLLSLNTCFSRKNFPFYSKYNLGKTFITNVLALWSTIYSRSTNINFYTNLNFVIDRNSRMIVSLQRDTSLEKLLDCCSYVSDRIQSLFPDMRIEDIRNILSKLNFNSINLLQRVNSELKTVKRAISQIRTASHVVLSYRPQLMAMSKYAAWLYNFGYIDEREFKFVVEQLRQSEVNYIKTDEQDTRGYYVSGISYKIGIKTIHNYAQLEMKNGDIAIHLNSPYEFIREEDNRMWDTHVKSIYKLLQKMLIDKQSALKTYINMKTDIMPNEFCIHESSQKNLLIYINETNRVVTLDRVKFKGKVKYNFASNFTWSLMENNYNYMLRRAGTGECYSELYKTVDSSSSLMEKILENLKTSLTYNSEMEETIFDAVEGIENEENKAFFFDSLNQIYDLAHKGLRECKSSEEFEVYLKKNEFDDLINTHTEMLELICQELTDTEARIQSVVSKLRYWSESLSNFGNLCVMLKFAMVNDSRGIKTYKANGADFHSLSSSESIICSDYDVFEMLKLIKACEACHTSNSTLNLIAFRDIRNSKYIPPYRRRFGGSVYFYYPLRLNNDVMSRLYEHKTISLSDIEITDSVREILRQNGFTVTGSDVKLGTDMLELNPVTITDEHSTFDSVSRQMRLTKKKSSYLIPANTLLLGELMKFLMLCIKGNEYDVQKMLSAHFDFSIERDDRMESLIKSIMTLRASGYVQRHFMNSKEEEILLGVATSLENFLILSTPHGDFIEPFDVQMLIKSVFSEKNKNKKLKVLLRIRSYISAKLDYLNDQCIYKNTTNIEINDLVFSSINHIDKEISELKTFDKTVYHDEFNDYLRTAEEAHSD